MAILGKSTVQPPPGLGLADDAFSAPVDSADLDLDVLANDTPAGGIRITAVAATGALPQGNLSIVGTAPAQKVRVARAGLAIGAYGFTYTAELIGDPEITSARICSLQLTSTALSSIIVTAPTPVTIGEGNSGTKNVTFIVSRSGDLSQACSVQWALEGDLNAADMAAGQATSGSLSWGANDGTARTVTIVVKGDATVEPNEVCRIRLSSPVGCTIGTATASVTIADDDSSTTPADYIQDLAYGGLALGVVVQDCGVGNLVIRNQASWLKSGIVLYLEHLDPIVAIQTENRGDHVPLGSTDGGYSDHTVLRLSNGSIIGLHVKRSSGPAGSTILARPRGGNLLWRIARLTSGEAAALAVPEANPDGSTKWAGQTRRIIACMRDESWQGEWERSGGTGTVPPSFAAEDPSGSYPTIWLDPPIDPVAQGWSIGDLILIQPNNNASPDSGPRGPSDANIAPPYGNSQYSSVNQGFRAGMPALKSAAYKYLAYAGINWQDYNRDSNDQRYIPIMLVGHRGSDGILHVKGNAYAGYTGAEAIHFGGGKELRQVIRIPADSRWTGRKLKKISFTLWRKSGGTGTVTVALRRAGSTIGGLKDAGDLITSTSVAAASIPVPPVDPNTGALRIKDYAGTSDPMQVYDLPTLSTVTVTAGEAYYLVFTPGSGYAAGEIGMCRHLNYLGRGVRGLLKADHQNNADRYQSRSGGDWTNETANFSSDNYMHLGCALLFGT